MTDLEGKSERRVTIGIVVKDCEGIVKEAIRSIANQTYPHELMEMIIVDGNSKDRTLSVVADMISNTDIKTSIYSDEGRGLGVARQRVVDNSSGEYLVWVDADAVIPDDYVLRLVQFIDKNPRLGAAKGIQAIANPTSLTAKVEDLSLFLKRSPKHFWDMNGIFRVKAIRQAGGFDPCIKGAAEDLDLIARIIKAGWLLTASNVKFYHRLDSWKQIWYKSIRYGYGIHYFNHKHKGLIAPWIQTFPVLFVIGLRQSAVAYRLTHQKIAFLFPFYYSGRSIPWWIGFARSHMDNYGHSYDC